MTLTLEAPAPVPVAAPTRDGSPLDERFHSVCLRCYPLHTYPWDLMPDRLVAVCGVGFARVMQPRDFDERGIPLNPCPNCRASMNRVCCPRGHMPGRNW